MNFYYLLNTAQYDALDKTQISYIHRSIDGIQILVITSQLVGDYLFMFESVKKFIMHSYYTTDEWFGDGGMLDLMEINTEIYIESLDD
jgi:hypothetical protein|tara:strand:- start:286 stop:549 length:264 start_codon:yes stop_codon:yes gene_type:complete